MNTPSVFIAALLATLVAAGCGPAGSSGDGSTVTGPPGLSHPMGASDIVLRVSTGGGFVPLEVNLRELPEFTLYGDGTVIVPGVVTAIYPGPAVMPLNTFRLSEEQVQELLTRADRAGLLEGGIDYGDMGSVGVSDMPTTTVILNADGKQVRHDAYALSPQERGARLSAAQQEARNALSQFIAALPQGASAEAYTPSALTVNVSPFRGERQPGSEARIWPLASDLATDGQKVSEGLDYRCFAVTGADAPRLLQSLSDANEQTEWLAAPGGGQAFRLVVRPMLPDEQACRSV